MALTSSFPNMAYIGVAILTTLFSTVGLLPVILGNFVSSFVLIPVTVLVLHMAGAGHDLPGAGPPKAAAKSSLARDILAYRHSTACLGAVSGDRPGLGACHAPRSRS